MSLVGARILNDITTLPNNQRMAYPISKPVLLDIPTRDKDGNLLEGDQCQCTHPSVCIPQSKSGKFGDHRWWMAMTPYPVADVKQENPSILYSDDGISWLEPMKDGKSINPVVKAINQDGKNINEAYDWYNADPNLVYNPEDGYMYLYWNAQGDYVGNYDEEGNLVVPVEGDDARNISAICRMTKSKDGINWSDPVRIKAVNHAGEEHDFTFGGSGIEVLDNGVWIGFSGQNTGGSSRTVSDGNMKIYMSNDGLEWKEMPRTYDNLAGTHWHLSARRSSDGYHFISSVAVNERVEAANLRLHYGYSPDGLAPLFDGTPLFGIDGVNFPVKRWYASCVVPIGQETSRVYFSGMGRDDKESGAYWRIGYFDIKLNNPYMTYVNSPLAKARYRALWHWFELRDKEVHYSVPFGKKTNSNADIGVKEMVLNKENVLHVVNTLHYSETPEGADKPTDTYVPVDIEVVYKHSGQTRTIKIGDARQKVTVEGGRYGSCIITKDELKALGMRHLDEIGFRINLVDNDKEDCMVPTKGTVSVYLVPQE